MTVTIRKKSSHDNVPALAVKALAVAQRRMKSAGRPIVIVKSGRLVRQVNGRTEVLKSMSGPVKVVSNDRP